MRSLELLSAHGTIDDAFAAAVATTPPIVDPVFVMAGEPTLLLPGDPDHPTKERAIDGSTRLVLRDGRWWAG